MSHLQAVKHAQQFVNEFSMSEGKLEEMVDMNWISPKRAEECKENLQEIESRGICAVQSLQDNSRSRLIHLSVACINRNEYKVTYDKVDGNWMCNCSKNINHKRLCPHRYLAKLFLHENMPSIMKSSTVTQNLTGNGCAEETEVNETGLSDMNEKEKSDFQQKTSYLMMEKMYPLPLPDPVKFNDSCQVNELIPVEEECCFWLTKPKFGKPTLVNKHAKGLGLQGVVRNIAVYSKICPQCDLSFVIKNGQKVFTILTTA